jgi:hypothetical protein
MFFRAPPSETPATSETTRTWKYGLWKSFLTLRWWRAGYSVGRAVSLVCLPPGAVPFVSECQIESAVGILTLHVSIELRQV